MINFLTTLILIFLYFVSNREIMNNINKIQVKIISFISIAFSFTIMHN